MVSCGYKKEYMCIGETGDLRKRMSVHRQQIRVPAAESKSTRRRMHMTRNKV